MRETLLFFKLLQAERTRGAAAGGLGYHPSINCCVVVVFFFLLLHFHPADGENPGRSVAYNNNN